MPTGYTAAIKDGIGFQEFALGCARAFGACITMRDEPSDTPIPDQFEPSNYHADSLKTANERLLQLQAMSPEECEAAALKEYLDGCERNVVRRQECADLRAKYEAMLERARAWQPPTSEHQGLKDFMIQQISDSIGWDCGTTYLLDPPRKSGDAWRSDNITLVERSIARHNEEHELEIIRAKQRTEWVSALRKSLTA